ncbi:uncharacterized protein LOC134223731 [Armigeres subalbatus]|uniref:uncharacterized protein LOC134223731 n=1 Tax=Armigeres subalbatus TaxID=124917 RepID=UPI002ED6BE0B
MQAQLVWWINQWSKGESANGDNTNWVYCLVPCSAQLPILLSYICQRVEGPAVCYKGRQHSSVSLQLGNVVTMAPRGQLRIAKDTESDNRPNVTVSTRHQQQSTNRQRTRIEESSISSGDRNDQVSEALEGFTVFALADKTKQKAETRIKRRHRRGTEKV